MVYIYKKIVGERAYYYLRISKRIKGKIIVKDIAYLGKDLSKLEAKLQQLPRQYEGEIKKAYRNIKKFIQGEYYLKKVKSQKLKDDIHLKKPLLEEVEALQLHYTNQFLKKDETTRKEALKNFLIDFAYNTTSLEGNTITLAEANKLLSENLTPKNRTLREIYDLQNTEKVFFELLNSKETIHHKLIIRIHDQLMENIDNRKGYRTHDIRVFKSHFESTPFPYVKTDIDLLLKWYRLNKKKLHPIVLAGIFHQKLEKIHPFSDGNGRTGRIILCYMLMRMKYPPLIIKKSNRSSYLDELSQGNSADLNSSEPKFYKELIEYLAEEMIDGYWNNFNL